MNDLEFNSGRSNSSGNSSGIGAMIFLILFATPFAGFGLVAFIKGAGYLIAGDFRNGIPLSIFGLIFSTIGFGLMAGAVIGRKKLKQKAELQARYPGKPWMTRPDWAAGKIKSSAMVQSYVYLIMGLAFAGIGGLVSCFALPEAWQKHNYAVLLVLIFPLVGIALLVAFINVWRSQQRFGNCVFELAQIPVPLGGALEGLIATGHPLALENELHLTCSCIRRVVTGSGKDRSTQDYILWQSEKIYSKQANLTAAEPGQTGIPVHFKLPNDQPECYSQGSESILWRLEAKTKMHGPRFRALFDLPVFRDAGAASVEADDADPTVALQAPIEEVRQSENSKIKISDSPEGRDFYFPAARNPGSALFVTIIFLVWSGIFYVLVHSKAPLIFPIFWGITDVFLLMGCLNAWFKSSQVTINSTRVRAVTRYLIVTRARQFNAGEVARFATKTGMRSGSQVFTDIRLIPCGSDEKFAATMGKMREPADANQLAMTRFRAAAGPSGVTIAGGIASAVEADWLVAEMNKALGRRNN
jgi:hypothetical protein